MTLPDLSIWAITLASIDIAVFTFAATFLSDAIEESRKKQGEAEKRKAVDFELKVTDLQNKVNELKSSGDSDGVEDKLKEIKKARRKHDKEIKRIRAKYNSLRFGPCIVLPGSAFVLSYICSEIYKSIQMIFPWSTIIWTASFVILIYGAYRVLRSLNLVQDINLVVDSPKERMKQAFQEALSAHDQESQETINVTFPKQTFPAKIAPGSEIKLYFRVNVLSGKAVHACENWFFIPDGFDLVQPKEFFKQADDFVVPNIRTVRFDLGTVIKGTYTSGTLTCIAPKIEGTYYILYRVKSEEVSSERLSLEYTVKQ